MEIKTNTTEEITFDIEGANGTATIENNKIVKVQIRLSATDENNQVKVLDEKFLRDVYKAIGDLLRHVDNKRDVGHKTANSWASRLPEDQRNLDEIVQEVSKPGIVGIKKDKEHG